MALANSKTQQINISARHAISLSLDMMSSSVLFTCHTKLHEKVNRYNSFIMKISWKHYHVSSCMKICSYGLFFAPAGCKTCVWLCWIPINTFFTGSGKLINQNHLIQWTMPKFVTCHDIFLHFWNPSCGHAHVYSFHIPVYTILTCVVFLLSLALRMLHLLKWRLHGKRSCQTYYDSLFNQI